MYWHAALFTYQPSAILDGRTFAFCLVQMYGITYQMSKRTGSRSWPMDTSKLLFIKLNAMVIKEALTTSSMQCSAANWKRRWLQKFYTLEQWHCSISEIRKILQTTFVCWYVCISNFNNFVFLFGSIFV